MATTSIPENQPRRSRYARSIDGVKVRGHTAIAERTPGVNRQRSKPVCRSSVAAETGERSRALLFVLLILSLFIPTQLHVGSLNLSPYRLLLVVLVLPLSFAVFSGKAGRVRLADIALLAYCGWGAVALFVDHGSKRAWQPSGILFVESMGAYCVGRYYIRTAADYRKLVTLLFWCVLILLPFAFIEAISGWNIPRALFSMLGPVNASAVIGARWGLVRVQSVFEHPILFGVTCGCILGPVHLVLGTGRSVVVRWTKTIVVMTSTFLAMSSGPLTALTAQAGLLFWNWALRRVTSRWLILSGLLAFMWALISILSNQSVPAFLMSHFSFSPYNAYYRVLIWDFGTHSVALHPLFGVGLGQWARPSWMGPSIDMFWLYHWIIYGVPSGLLMMLTFLASVISVARARPLDPALAVYKTAHLVSMAFFFLVGWTVHFWDATYVLFLVLLGSGAWLAEAEQTRARSPSGPRNRHRNDSRSDSIGTRRPPFARAAEEKQQI